MKIEIKGKFKENIGTLMRRGSYSPHYDKYKREMTYVRKIQGTMFPRFHIHIWEERIEYLKLNIHLDAKRESYGGVSMHSGEYDSGVVIRESERIKQVFATILQQDFIQKKEVNDTEKRQGTGGKLISWLRGE